jgi:RNA polymerase sigma-70 factor (ECF subfamily)
MREPRPDERERDDRLIERYQTGQRDAAGELYAHYFESIYGYARAELRNTHDAEDAGQQTFLQMLSALSRYRIDPARPFRTWLFGIAHNCILDIARKRNRVEVERPATIAWRQGAIAATDESPAVEWLSDIDLQIFMRRLPPAQRQALFLRYAMDFSTEEIADVLGRSPGAVRILEHRGRQTLKDQIVALRSAPGRGTRRAPMLTRIRAAPVLRGRRFALNGPAGGAGALINASARWR